MYQGVTGAWIKISVYLGRWRWQSKGHLDPVSKSSQERASYTTARLQDFRHVVRLDQLQAWWGSSLNRPTVSILLRSCVNKALGMWIKLDGYGCEVDLGFWFLRWQYDTDRRIKVSRAQLRSPVLQCWVHLFWYDRQHLIRRFTRNGLRSWPLARHNFHIILEYKSTRGIGHYHRTS